MVREYDDNEYLHPDLTLQGLIEHLNFCKEGIARFRHQTESSQLASAENVIRELREFFSPTEPYFIKVLDHTLDALTCSDRNGQRHVRQPHLLNELTLNLDYCESELGDFRTQSAVRQLSMMEEVIESARSLYRVRGQELPAFFKYMEMTLDAVTNNYVDEYAEPRRRVREAAARGPSPCPSEPLPALPASMGEKEKESDAMRENGHSYTKLSSTDDMEIGEPLTQIEPADAERLAQRLAERATSREMVLKEHPAYRNFVSEWLAHSSTLPFDVTTQQIIQVGVRNLVLRIGNNVCQSHASLFWAIICYIALHYMLKRASKAEKGELSGIMKQAKLHSSEMERRYARFFAKLYDVLGGSFLIVTAKDLVALRKSFKPFKHRVRFPNPVRDKFKAARCSFEECIDREDPDHCAGLTVYDKGITAIIDSIIADDQPRVDAAIQAFKDMAARH
ncbi:hypothetical protein HDU90_005007 [Geranomyces variabilis]|nr:hypothetical protein HDU90_005007 [Geranomyces variabilis]